MNQRRITYRTNIPFNEYSIPYNQTIFMTDLSHEKCTATYEPIHFFSFQSFTSSSLPPRVRLLHTYPLPCAKKKNAILVSKTTFVFRRLIVLPSSFCHWQQQRPTETFSFSFFFLDESPDPPIPWAPSLRPPL